MRTFDLLTFHGLVIRLAFFIKVSRYLAIKNADLPTKRHYNEIFSRTKCDFLKMNVCTYAAIYALLYSKGETSDLIQALYIMFIYSTKIDSIELQKV